MLVTTCGAAFAAKVAEDPLDVGGDRHAAGRPEVLRIVSTDHFTGAVRSTCTDMAEEMPSSTCSNTL